MPFLRTILLTALLATPVAAQHISLKTVPISTGEQFLLFPSANLGMGSLSIALDDPLLDPFVNPALGARVEGVRVFTTPTFYGDDQEIVGGRSFPVGALLGGERIFGGVSFAVQQIRDARRQQWIPLTAAQRASLLGDDGADNVYAVGLAGARLNGGRTAVGVSGFWSDLGALDGVNRLYGNSISIDQSGQVTELRAGVLHELAGDQTLEAMVLKADVDMRHEVVYADVRWPGGEPWTMPPVVTTRSESNLDRTTTWGAHLRYIRPLVDGWRLGATATGNWKSHPKIPNYDVVNIPRDPGDSQAYELGIGLARTLDRNTFGIEVGIQPARSHTWAFADTALTAPSGAVIGSGERTVDNHFRFTNFGLATGLRHSRERVDLQLGLGVRRTAYDLDQDNYVTEVRTLTEESWMEWAPSWGIAVRLSGMDLRYAGRANMKGFPDCTLFCGTDEVIAMPDSPGPGGGDFLPAVTQPVFFPDWRVTTHQFVLSVPIGS